MTLPAWWDDLLEIQSIDNLIVAEQKVLAAQQERLQSLARQKEQKQTHLAELATNLAQLKKDMQLLETTLDGQSRRRQELKRSLTMVTTSAQLAAAESEQASLQQTIEANEDLLLTQLTQQETWQQEQADGLKFLQGLAQTTLAIQNEVSSLQQVAQSKISTWEKRINQLLAALDPNVKHLFQPIYERWRFKQPISFLKGEHCSVCAYTLGREQAAQINRGEIAEVCLNCGRLLAPEAQNVLSHHQKSREDCPAATI